MTTVVRVCEQPYDKALRAFRYMLAQGKAVRVAGVSKAVLRELTPPRLDTDLRKRGGRCTESLLPAVDILASTRV